MVKHARWIYNLYNAFNHSTLLWENKPTFKYMKWEIDIVEEIIYFCPSMTQIHADVEEWTWLLPVRWRWMDFCQSAFLHSLTAFIFYQACLKSFYLCFTNVRQAEYCAISTSSTDFLTVSTTRYFKSISKKTSAHSGDSSLWVVTKQEFSGNNGDWASNIFGKKSLCAKLNGRLTQEVIFVY